MKKLIFLFFLVVMSVFASAKLYIESMQHNSFSSFVFVTFEHPSKLRIGNFLHSSFSDFIVQVNFSNRTDVSLDLIFSSEMIEGEKYNMTFIISNEGNQYLENISFNFENYSIMFNLPKNKEQIFLSEFAAFNNTIFNANVSIIENESNYTNNYVFKKIKTIIPVLITDFRFIPEVFNEGDLIKVFLNLSSLDDYNGTLFYSDNFTSFFINGTTEFLISTIAKNNSNFSVLFDFGTFYLYNSKKMIINLIPDISARIFNNKLIVKSNLEISNFTVRIVSDDISFENDYFIDYIYREKIIDINYSSDLMVYLDYFNDIPESDEENNKIEFFYGKKMYVDTTPVLRDYVYDNLKGYSFVDSVVDADLILSVGSTDVFKYYNSKTLQSGWGKYSSGIKYYDKFSAKPYSALINYIDVNNKQYIFVYGNKLSGTIAGLKEFVKGNFRMFIYDDFEAVKIYDYFSLFDKITDKEIKNALYDDMHEEIVLTTIANGVELRLLHLKPKYSEKLINYVNPKRTPVILARGIFSNLTDWIVLGRELVSEMQDTWLIEITGGPSQDGPNAPNYDFNDLTDYYVPALINKVRVETGKDKIKYVGFSNGCRSALSALDKGTINPIKIDVFIAVACPGAFEGESPFMTYFKENGDELMIDLQNFTHVTGSDVGRDGLLKYCNWWEFRCQILTRNFEGTNKISYNLAKQYYLWINSIEDKQPGINLSLNKFIYIRGFMMNFEDSDVMVSAEDSRAIYNSIISNDKTLYVTRGLHAGPGILSLPDQRKTKEIIKKELRE